MDKLAFDLHHHEDIEPCQKCHAGCKYCDGFYNTVNLSFPDPTYELWK